MNTILEVIHPKYPPSPKAIAARRAVRGIALRGSSILLLYTRRYDDFSVPGGGVSENEGLEDALVREMIEETGARSVEILSSLGRIDESRPHWGDFDAMHMQSFVFHCLIEGELGEPTMEAYETANGMRPVWVELEHAIAHNLAVIQRAENSMGTSIVRETRLLQWVKMNMLPSG